MDPLEKIFDQAADIRKFEIGLFWQRSLFFWGFIAAAFVAYAELAKNDGDADLRLVVAGFGIICSVAWTLANRGSKYWQENWERKLKVAEQKLFGESAFAKNSEINRQVWWGAARYSVTRLTIALSDFTTIMWVFLFFRSMPKFTCSSELILPALLFFFLVFYVIAMLKRCQSRNR